MPHVSSGMQACIDECLDCHSICIETVTHCLQQGGEHADPTHIGLLLDCAESCQTSANFTLRNSKLHNRICGVCAEVCTSCADSCDSMGGEEFMKRCAESCRRCAESCRKMAGPSSRAA